MMHKVRWDAKSKQYVGSLVACREGQQDSREAVTIITTTRLEDVARHTGTGARGQNRSRAWELLRWCCNPFPARRAMRIIEADIHFLPILCEKAKSCVVTCRQSARFLPLPIRLFVAHKRGAVVTSVPTKHRHTLVVIIPSNPIPSNPPISSRPTGGSALASPGHNARSHSNTWIC
jgi:hypothetical protein